MWWNSLREGSVLRYMLHCYLPDYCLWNRQEATNSPPTISTEVLIENSSDSYDNCDEDLDGFLRTNTQK